MSVLCPRCERDSYTPYGEKWERGDPFPPALSRLSRGNVPEPLEIYVCSACGRAEAMRQFNGLPLQPPDDWPVGEGE